MLVLRTGLARRHDDLLRTAPVRVHVGNDLKTCLLQLVQPEIGDLKTFTLGWSNCQSSIPQHRGGLLNSLLVLETINHGRSPETSNSIPIGDQGHSRLVPAKESLALKIDPGEWWRLPDGDSSKSFGAGNSGATSLSAPFRL
jgi:hypothetical protein